MASFPPNKKIIVGVDYGTTCTGISFIDTEEPEIRGHLEYILNWPLGKVLKAPSRIAYFEQKILCWGSEVLPGMAACSWTKLLLDSGTDPSEFDDTVLETAAALGIFQLPPEKTPVDVVADYLYCIHQHTWEELDRRFHEDKDRLFVEFWFTIPATWSEYAKAQTKEAATRAGFGQRPKDKLVIMPEPEAAAQAVFKMAQTELKTGDGMLVCDCGGGTVDIATYLITGVTPDLCMQKLTSVQGGKCGGAAIDSRFYQLMKTRFGASFEALPPYLKAPGSALMDKFEKAKQAFSRVTRKEYRLRFDMRSKFFDPRHYDTGHIIITGSDMQSLFDPVITNIIKLINTQLEAAEKECNYPVINHIFMVGGLSASQYVQRALQCYHNPGKLSVTVPSFPQMAVATGAALCGAYGKYNKMTRKCPQNYGFETTRLFYPVIDNLDHISPWGIFDAMQFVNKSACWVVRKDQQYPHGHSCVQTLSRFYQPGDPLAIPIPVYACGMLEPPDTMSHESAILVCHIVADFTQLNLNKFTHREIDNQMVYYLNYCVETVFAANCDMLQFTVRALGETIGEQNLQMHDI